MSAILLQGSAISIACPQSVRSVPVHSSLIESRRKCRFTEITQNNGHNMVQAHLRSPILLPVCEKPV